MKKYLLLSIVCFIGFNSFAQIDFNDFIGQTKGYIIKYHVGTCHIDSNTSTQLMFYAAQDGGIEFHCYFDESGLCKTLNMMTSVATTTAALTEIITHACTFYKKYSTITYYDCTDGYYLTIAKLSPDDGSAFFSVSKNPPN